MLGLLWSVFCVVDITLWFMHFMYNFQIPSGTCGLVAMPSALHAEGRQLDPARVYVYVSVFQGWIFSHSYMHTESQFKIMARLVQSAERKALNLVVVGSNPTRVVCHCSWKVCVCVSARVRVYVCVCV